MRHLLALAALLCPQDSRTRPVEPVASPPGCVLVPAGPAAVGTPLEEVRAEIALHPERAERLAVQVPRHRVEVAGFFLGTTEVTHGAWLEYVRATGAAPLLEWGRPAVERAREAYLEAEEEARRVARAEKRRPPERVPFDEVAWWRAHRREVVWSLPEALRNLPATYVDHPAAEAYADWAGLRLPSEEELFRAGRAESGRAYPWGDAFDARLVVSRESATGPAPAGSRAPGPHGVHDLVGSLWEWTSSPFVAYPGAVPWRMEVTENGRQRVLDVEPRFDPDERVLLGGSWRQGADGVRLATRLGLARRAARDVVGLRLAGSTRPALDRARRLSGPGERELDLGRLAALDRWRVDPAQPSVPLGYEVVAFVPTADLEARETQDLERSLRNGSETFLGLFHTSLPLERPALAPGTYRVSWGDASAHAGQGARSGGGLVWREASGVAVAFEEFTPRARRDEGGRPALVHAGRRVELELVLATRSRGRVLAGRLAVEAQALGVGSWRE